MRWRIVLSCLVLLLFCSVVSVQAELIGPEYPPPGNVTLGSSGSAGGTGGLTYSYSGFDPTEYAQLYWGPWDGALIGVSLNGPGVSGSEVMTPSGFTTSQAVWTGHSTWSYHLGNSDYLDQDIDTRFTLTVSGANLLDANTLGENTGILTLVNGDYQVNLLFEAKFFGTWMPVLVGFNTYHTYGSTEYTFSGGFYHTSTAVPEPSTLLLLGGGLVGLTAYRRRLKTG